MRKKFEELKKKHPDAILLFREGSFYVSIYEDASEVARILNLDLTFIEGNISAAFPHQALDTYLPKLIRAGKRVAICDKIDVPENKTKVKQSNEKKMEVKQLSLGSIAPSPMNPRKTFNEEDLKELATNIKNQGLLQPITVRPKDKSKYEIVCGERRYRACSLNGMRFIPCIVKEMTDEEAFDAMITENLQRKDVDPMEEAFAFSQLVAQGKTTEEIALRFGKSQRFVQERIKLDSLIPELKKKVTDGEMAIGAAFIICKLTEEAQKDFYEEYEDDDDIIKHDAEQFCDDLFMTIDKASWEDKFEGPCKCTCDKCPFNDCNAGNLFYSMKEHDARCTNRTKFEDKATDWNLEIIRRNADVLVKLGEPLEADKTVVLYESVSPWMSDKQKNTVTEYISKIKEMGYEAKENKGDLFERYSHYREDDERLQALIADKKVYRCIHVGSNYRGLSINVRYFTFCKTVTAEESNEADAMKLVGARKEAIIKNGTNTAKKLRGLLSGMDAKTIETKPLTKNETYILMCLLLADTSHEFRDARKLTGYTEGSAITEYVKEHPTEVHQVARDYMRTKLAGAGTEYYSHLQECQKLLIQEWLSAEAKDVIETMSEKLNTQLAKIDEQLTALGYDSEGKKLQ